MANSSILPIVEVDVSHANPSVSVIVEEVETEFQLRFFTFNYESRLDLLEDCLEVDFFTLKLKEVDDFVGNNSIVFLTEKR